MATALVVFLKELKDHLRDRRSLLTVLLSSVVMGPLSLFLVSHFVSGLEERDAQREVVVAGAEHAPDLANFIERQAFRLRKAPPDYEAQLRTGKLVSAVIVVPPDFQAKLARAEAPEIVLVYDDSHTESLASIRGANRLLQGFNREQGMLRLIARGVSPTLLQPTKLEELNLASSQAKGAQLLFLVPMFALVACLIGAQSVAIDVTAGERERGSLEPLLLNPVDTRGLVLGKWAVVSLFGAVVVLLTLLGFIGAMHVVRNETLSAMFQFGPREFGIFATVLIPFACFAGALLMLVAAYGRSFKEAQTYAGYIVMIVNFIPLVTFFTAVRDAAWQLFVPALAQQMVMARATRGAAVSPADLAVPGVVALAAAFLCLALLARFMRNERVVFGRS